MTDLKAADMPLVTVVMPCYNHEHYVERAIGSVLGQTYPYIQLVVIDDGSRDGSPELLRRLAAQHGFELVCQENRGVCRTLNRGVREHAHGHYIALLASDDFWHPDKISLQINALCADSTSEFCFSRALEFQDEERLQLGRQFPGRLLQGDVLRGVFVRQHVPAGTMLFTRRLYDELGGFDETLKEEDWDFVIRSAAATRFVGLEQALLYYRSHAGNTMKTRARTETFRQKALILSKSMHLVGPWWWLLAMMTHFGYDIVWSRLRQMWRE